MQKKSGEPSIGRRRKFPPGPPRDGPPLRSDISYRSRTVLRLVRAFASSHCARIQTSRSSSVVRITGIALGRIERLEEFAAVVRTPDPAMPSDARLVEWIKPRRPRTEAW